MNALTPGAPGSGKLPTRYYPVPASAALQRILHTAENAPDMTVPTPLMEEAKSLLRQIEPAYAPAHPGLIMLWLGQLDTASSFPLSREDFGMRAPMVAEALSDLPTSVFTVETRNDVARTVRFFGAEAIHTALVPFARDIRLLRGQLFRLVNRAAPVPTAPRPGQAEIDSIAKKFRGQFAEAMADATQQPQSPRGVQEDRPKARYASQGQLIAMYREQAKSGPPELRAAAETRLRMLERAAP